MVGALVAFFLRQLATNAAIVLTLFSKASNRLATLMRRVFFKYCPIASSSTWLWVWPVAMMISCSSRCQSGKIRVAIVIFCICSQRLRANNCHNVTSILTAKNAGDSPNVVQIFWTTPEANIYRYFRGLVNCLNRRSSMPKPLKPNGGGM